MAEFFGKYRGTVKDNRDPLKLGRILVEVPSVLGDVKNWAMPCVPYAGPKVGFYAIPPKEASVWVEFEAGDLNYPIWSGCFWEKDQLPAEPAEPEVKVFRTEGFILRVSNHQDNKGFTIEVTKPIVSHPLKLVMNPQGIEINNNDQTIAKFTENRIDLTNKSQTQLSLTADDIELVHDPVQIKLLSQKRQLEIKNGFSTINLTGNKITIDQRGNLVNLTDDHIEIVKNPNKIEISAQGVKVSSPIMTLNITAASIELQGGLGNIKVTPAGVNVNNGALEVT